MSHFDILIPFGLPPAELARDIGRALQLPCLSTLLAKSQSRNVLLNAFTESDDEFSRSLPHERWLASTFGLPGNHAQTSPPLAPVVMKKFGLDPEDGYWFLIQPVHLHIARDHLVLTDLRQLSVAEHEAHVLFDAIAPLISDSGHELRFGNNTVWFLRADAWRSLCTSTPDAAAGRNIDIWMPGGAAALAWRKLQNEVQMTWFAHPLQTERESRGLSPVNSLWMWGGGDSAQANVTNAYDTVVSVETPWNALAPRSQSIGAADAVAEKPERALVILDDLIPAALAADWGSWIAHFNKLETAWFTPLLGALKTGKVDSITVLIGDGVRLQSWTCSRTTLRKFWLRPSLAGILA